MERDADFWIRHLQMLPHPEGGFYRESYRSDLLLPKSALPKEFRGERPVSTAIYFLLRRDEFSAFHRIASDEIWHFYSGGILEIFEIESDGSLLTHLLGNNPTQSAQLQVVIKRGNWFASRPLQTTAYALAGCTVAPGFHFDEFEMASRENLISEFPQHQALITSLTR